MKNLSLKYTYQSIISVLLVFLVISFVVLMNIKIDSRNIRNTIGILETEEIFKHIIKSENHNFFPELDNPIFTTTNISNLAFQLATSIKPTDARTFLGNELPGLRFFDTEIIVAGEGTNLTNLPYESSPPLEVLQNERKVAEELLKEEDNPQDNNPVPNPETKTVFIYQSHSWESFLPLLVGATKPNDAISSDERANVVGLGERLATNLKKKGIGVEHDKTNMTQELKNKGWDYQKAYAGSRAIVEAAANNNSQLNYFIDIHRDSAGKEVTTTSINGVNYARLFFIIGKENKNYLENIEVAKVLNDKLKAKYPGISRGVGLKTYSDGNGVYNQDISNNALLLEVGGVDNTLEELQRSIDAFSEVLAEHYWESNETEEVNGNG
jgi:stage II sporulation protein P